MQDSSAYCEALVRAGDRDRFLAALFAPAEHRGALHALYAFNIEIARVREIIREPLAGEIRLQWWNDAIAGDAAGEVAANPVAAALLAAVARYRLPGEQLTGLIAARRFDLYNDPMAKLTDFDDYAEATSSAVLELAARILGADGMPGLGRLALHAGLGYAIAGLLQAFPIHAARGQVFLPLEVLQPHGVQLEDLAARHATPGLRAALAEMRRKAREHLAQAARAADAIPAAALPALLPVALVQPVLERMERADYDPFLPFETPQWRRQWRLWRAARRPGRIFA
ncbi:MAG TPA: squalene/phytoene synthase family protein [Xanthobacteraceae bacterium]|nr:squalene/phytoene synthase family protein [Xanthobacteraceae bacterium]